MFRVVVTFEVSLAFNHLISTPTNAHTKIFFTLKHLKSLQHVSIIRSSSGSYTAPC